MRVEYLTRAEWGGEWVRGPWTEALPDGEAVVHHVGGGARMGEGMGRGYEASRKMACTVFLWLNVYATTPKSEGGKGYSFLDYDALGWYDWVNDIGWIAEGRGMYMSAATRDRNELAEAFCLCGNFSLREPDAEEIELAAQGIAYMARQGWTTKTPKIYGHRDNPAHPGATGCPGDYFYPHMGYVEDRARQIIAGEITPDPDPTPEKPSMDKIRYFRTPASPTAVWQTTDGFTATKVQKEVADARRAAGFPFGVEVLTATEAALFTYVDSLEPGTIGLT